MIQLLTLICLLIAMPAFASQSEKDYFGIYGENDFFVYIRTWDELDRQLTFFDSNGAVRALHRRGADRYFSGPSLVAKKPVTIEIEFQRSGTDVTGALWKEGGNARALKRTHSYEEKDVRFKSGPTNLSGTLFVPTAGSSPYPAVVLVHGSNLVTRDFFGPIAYHFVRNGIAVLAYDKRGVAESEGDFFQADFQTLAADASAAVDFLRGQNGIDSKRIGLWGISQGGWIAPLAASQSPHVSFLMLLSSAAVTPQKQELQAQEQELRLSGTTPDLIAKSLEKTRADFKMLREEETAQWIESEIRKLKAEKSAVLKQHSLSNPYFLKWYGSILDYDPVPVLQKTGIPVLVIHGALDRTVPLEPNLKILKDCLTKAGNKNFKVVVLPDGNHALLKAKTGSNKEFSSLGEFAPGFFEFMTSWITKAQLSR